MANSSTHGDGARLENGVGLENGAGLEDEILKSLREGNKRSNLVEVDFGLLGEEEVSHHIAVILDYAQPASSQDFGNMFSAMKTYFMHTFIDQSTATKKFKMRSKDFFRGAMYVDYLCNALLGSHTFLDEHNFTGKTLKQLVDESRDSFKAIRRTTYFDEHNSQPPSYSRLISPTFQAQVVSDVLIDLTTSPQVKQWYAKARGMMDLKAGFFIDCILQSMDEKPIDDIEKAIDQHGFYKASVVAYAAFYRSHSDEIVRRVVGG